MIALPPETPALFEHLSRGLFVARDSQQPEIRKFYLLLTTHLGEYQQFFHMAGMSLEAGRGYFYLSQPLAKAEQEERLEKVLRYLSLLEFLWSVQPGLQAGEQISTSEWGKRVEKRPDLLLKLERLPLRGTQEKGRERLAALFRLLEREGFFEADAFDKSSWRVLASFDYLTRWAERIQQTQAS